MLALSQPLLSRWPQGSNEQTQKHEKHKTQKPQMIHIFLIETLFPRPFSYARMRHVIA